MNVNQLELGMERDLSEAHRSYLAFRRRPHIRCFGLIQVPHADPTVVAKYVSAVMEDADGLAYSVEELGRTLVRLVGRDLL